MAMRFTRRKNRRQRVRLSPKEADEIIKKPDYTQTVEYKDNK